MGEVRGMKIRGEGAENLKKKGVATKMKEKSKPAPSREFERATPSKAPIPISHQDLSREKPAGILHKRPQICTTVGTEFD